MDVSRQQPTTMDEGERGPRARTRRLMLDTASRLMQGGAMPSVSEVAEAAAVSRATAYRYFPTQAALVHAVVDEALGPILTWQSASRDSERRVAELIDAALPRIDQFEATFKAALKLALEQWVERRSGISRAEPQFRRGHRMDLLRDAIGPLAGALPGPQFERLAQALSLVFGVEALIVLKDIWGLDLERTREVVQWAAHALVGAAIHEGSAAP